MTQQTSPRALGGGPCKTLIVAPTARVGGARTYLIQLARAIEQRGDGADWVFWLPRELENVVTAPTGTLLVFEHEQPGRGFHDLLANWRKRRRDRATLEALIAEHRPDVVFVASEFGYAGLGVPQVLLVRNRIYYDAEWLRGVDSFKQRIAILLRRFLAARSMRKATHLIFPSRAMETAVSDFLGLRVPSTVVHYGAPEAGVSEPRPTASGAPLRLLNVANYYPQKNIGVLLAAVKLLAARGLAVKLILTGKPDPLFGAQGRADLAALESLGDLVELLPDVSHEVALRLYNRADIFVFPSTCESFGHPLLEAMVNGLAVAAADTAVNHELCGEQAAYFPARDALALADLLESMGAGELPPLVPGDIAERFSWSAHLEGLTRVLQASRSA